jgi:spermidine/putrescine transport system substrate-binding protein
VYTWANYTDDALLKSFQEKTGINAIVDIFDSNETMLAKMQAGGGNAYSIIYPSDYMVTQMAGLGLLTALDKSRIKGLTNLRTKWKDPTYDPNNEHSIPTTWGTTGLIYDPKRLGTKIEGWSYVWDHVNALNRKVTLINDVREVMGATLKFLGYSFNDTDPTQIQKAYDKLVNLKPAIASFMTNGWEDQIATGDLSVSMAYSSDALALIEENPELSYVIPKTGASLWTDTMVIPKSAPNVNAAYEWINFILEPENSAQLVQRLKFATPNQAAYELLPAELKNNQKLYPPEAILEKCEGVAPLPQKTTDLYDRYWTQLTST